MISLEFRLYLKNQIDGDGLSTATFSKGIKGGMDYIEQFEGVDAIFISKEKKVYETSGLKGQFELTDKDFQMDTLKKINYYYRRK